MKVSRQLMSEASTDMTAETRRYGNTTTPKMVLMSPKPKRWLQLAKACTTVLKILTAFICTFVLFYQGGQCVQRYLDKETKTILSIKKTGESTFPALSICPAFGAAYNRTFLSEYGIAWHEYKSGWFYGAQPHTHRLDGKSFFEKAAFRLVDLLRRIRLVTEDSRQPEVIVDFEQDGWQSMDIQWAPKPAYNFGNCYAVQLGKGMTKLGIISVEFYAKMDIYIYLHHPEQFTRPETSTKAYALLGQMLFVDLSYELTESNLGRHGSMACDSAMSSAYDQCAYEGFARKLEEEFGCVVPWVPLTGSRTICDYVDEPNYNVSQRFNYWWASGQSELCFMPCASMEFFLGLPTLGTMEAETSYIKLYLKPTVKVKKMVLDYSWLSMLAEIGGYTGLLLGISVLNVATLVDRFFVTIL